MPRNTDGTLSGKPRRKRTNSAETHRLHAARRFMAEYGARALDQRTRAARSLAAWRDAIVTDLGGEENVSAQRHALLDLAVKTKLLLDGLDVWLLNLDSLVNEKGKAADVLHVRMRLSDSLAKHLGQLGLERVAVEGTDLTAYVQEKYGQGKGDGKREDNV